MSYAVVAPNAGRGASDWSPTCNDHRSSTGMATVTAPGTASKWASAVVGRADRDGYRRRSELESGERVEPGLASLVGSRAGELGTRRDPRRVLVDEEVERAGQRRGEVELVVERVDETRPARGRGCSTVLTAPSAIGTTM